MSVKVVVMVVVVVFIQENSVRLMLKANQLSTFVSCKSGSDADLGSKHA